MTLDKYSQLKMAGNVLGFSMQEFADSIGTHPNVVRRVIGGKDTSARISKAVDVKIAEAEAKFDEYRKHRDQKAPTT
jgi:hypothetical protein